MRRIFVEELGVSERKIINSLPLENFGKNSPDINQHSCKDFIERLEEDDCQFGAVINPDGVSYYHLSYVMLNNNIF